MDKRVKFDFEVEFSNGGGLQGQGFRLDIEGDDISDEALATHLVRDMRLLMVGAVRILNKEIIAEPHKRRPSNAPSRPDLSQADPAVRDYVETVEAEIERLRSEATRVESSGETEMPLEPDEPPTTLNLVTLATSGLAKRTPRHLYSRQRRGGMGVFDIETAADDAAGALALADARDHLLIITSQARAFRLPVYFLNEAVVRARPQPYVESLSLNEGERWALALPIRAHGSLAVLSQVGHVRAWPAHLFSETMRVGMSVLKPDDGGPPVAAGWIPTEGDVFIATQQGSGVRFPVKSVPAQGAQGIRLDAARGDTVVAVVGVKDDSGVFLLGADGRGTIRLMSGFNANRAPGAGGKIAMKTDHLIGAAAVSSEAADLFIITRLCKIIRFKAREVPAKEGAVQGVNCISLRGDEPTAVVTTDD